MISLRVLRGLVFRLAMKTSLRKAGPMPKGNFKFLISNLKSLRAHLCDRGLRLPRNFNEVF
jgi:hypothetical protein